MPHHPAEIWSFKGQLQHVIFSPKGGIEGLLIHSNEVPVQFVLARHDEANESILSGLRPGQQLVLEGTEQPPSSKGDAVHGVYELSRVVSVDKKAARPVRHPDSVSGTAVRFNYARHGQANGVVLDTGDFVHTKPDGLLRAGIRLGDQVKAEGVVQPLKFGPGRVCEAQRVNGKAMSGE